MNAVDTNIFLYSADLNEPRKQRIAKELLRQLNASIEPTVLLWQVLCELAQQLRRWNTIGKLTSVEFNRRIELIRENFPLVLPSAVVFDQAMVMCERYSLSHWDSMLLGACKAAGIARLYTEDMGSPTTIDRIELVNPFAS